MPPKKPYALSNFLREKRLLAGLTQREVAKHLGYTSAQFVSNWERGLADPPVETLRLLAALYKVPLRQMHELVLEVTIEKVHHEMRIKFYGRKR